MRHSICGCTCTPFTLRFYNYKACYRKIRLGSSVPQMEFFRHFSEEEHHRFLEDISVKIIDKLTEKDRISRSFLQYKPDTFTSRGLHAKELDL